MIYQFASTSWVQVMLCIVPLLLVSSSSGAGRRAWWRGTEPKLRAWFAMLFASLAAYAMQPVEGQMPFVAYACIDLLAGLAVLSSPSGLYSRLIGALFLVMLIVEGGAGIGGSDGTGFYQSTMLFLGWVMWAILLGWGAHDAGKSLAAWFGGHSRPHNVGAHLASARQRSAGVIEP